jgi:transcription elongation factor Elf1
VKVKEQPLPKGFNCHICGKWNDFGPVVLASWNDTIIVKCHACPAKSKIRRGKVEPIREK